ncbi:MAG TPA: hypothetical protein VMH39_05975 [Gemmatimonadaceae bacterium]|nr:hypothetical protein [Gemmatimonadaceae bacterium]
MKPTVSARVSVGLVLVALCGAAVGMDVSPAAGPGVPPARRVPADPIPASLPDSVYWRLTTELSEPGGEFPYDNFVSNESAFEDVLPQLQATAQPGGAYIGVGPEQNFSYIAAMRPRIAFVVDIRRAAAIQHLLCKALFELSPDRAEFVSRLFSRPRPAALSTAPANARPEAMFEAYASEPGDRALFDRNLAAVETLLLKTHGFTLSPADLSTLTRLYDAFYRYGPDITYAGSGGPFATFRQMAVVADSGGVQRGFLANEANYQIVRDLQRRNLVVFVVGDFAGPKALRAIGDYLRAHGALVNAFYTSNVEQWLFTPDNTWRQFYANVATLPMDSTSVFVRATPTPAIALSTDASYARTVRVPPAPDPPVFHDALARLGIPSRRLPCTTPPAPRIVLDSVRQADGAVRVVRRPGFRVGPGAGYGDLAVCLASMSDVVRAFEAGLIDRYSQVIAIAR